MPSVFEYQEYERQMKEYNNTVANNSNLKSKISSLESKNAVLSDEITKLSAAKTAISENKKNITEKKNTFDKKHETSSFIGSNTDSYDEGVKKGLADYVKKFISELASIETKIDDEIKKRKGIITQNNLSIKTSQNSIVTATKPTKPE